MRAVLRAVKPGGIVIVETFAADRPDHCSGPTVRHDNADALHAEFGAPFTLLKLEGEERHMSGCATQKFIYCICRKGSSGSFFL